MAWHDMDVLLSIEWTNRSNFFLGRVGHGCGCVGMAGE